MRSTRVRSPDPGALPLGRHAADGRMRNSVRYVHGVGSAGRAEHECARRCVPCRPAAKARSATAPQENKQIEGFPGHFALPVSVLQACRELWFRVAGLRSLFPVLWVQVSAAALRPAAASAPASPESLRAAAGTPANARAAPAVSSACISSGSRRKRSAPFTSHRSSLSSTLRSSLCSSGW
jgi:hypothetical protein